MQKFTFNTIQLSLLNSLTKEAKKNHVNYLRINLPWVMQGSCTISPTLNNYFSLHVCRQHRKMMDYYEPMTVIHMTDDLQLVTKTKKKKVTFAPDADKHIVLIQGSDSVPINLISESETHLVTVDADIVTEGQYNLNFTLPKLELPSGEETVKPSISFLSQRHMMAELGMLKPVVPLPEIGKEVDLEMHKVMASTKKKMFPDVNWEKVQVFYSQMFLDCLRLSL